MSKWGKKIGKKEVQLLQGWDSPLLACKPQYSNPTNGNLGRTCHKFSENFKNLLLSWCSDVQFTASVQKASAQRPIETCWAAVAHWHSSLLTPSVFSCQDLLCQGTVKDFQTADVCCQGVVNWIPLLCRVCSTTSRTRRITYLQSHTL